MACRECYQPTPEPKQTQNEESPTSTNGRSSYDARHKRKRLDQARPEGWPGRHQYAPEQ